MTSVLDEVAAHLRAHYSRSGIVAEPESASVTFLGVEALTVLRFGPDADGLTHYTSLGCSRHPMTDPTAAVADPLVGPRAEIVVSVRGRVGAGLARTVAVLAATPAVEGVVLQRDALLDLGSPLWEGSPFTAVLLSDSGIDACVLPEPSDPVHFLAAVPITATEAAWVRLKGADAMRDAWRADGVDVHDTERSAAQPK